MHTNDSRRAGRARLAVLSLLTAASALAAGAALAAMHATAEFESGATRPVKIALLPAHVELQKQKMIRREAKVEEAGELEDYLGAAVAKELESRGYAVQRLTAASINADPGLQELVVDADRRYGELLTQIAVKLPRQVAKRRYQAGDEMQLLASRLGVDSVAFVRLQMIAAGKGLQILNQGMGGAQTMMSVSLIDGRTRDIEAYFVLPLMKRGKAFGGYDAVMKHPAEEMSRFAASTLDDLPKADPSLRKAPAGGGDVVKDVESLLKP